MFLRAIQKVNEEDVHLDRYLIMQFLEMSLSVVANNVRGKNKPCFLLLLYHKENRGLSVLDWV